MHEKYDSIKYINCSGSLGDSYINLLKLYNLSKESKIHCHHFTYHDYLHSAIKSIYSLCDISVDFRDNIPDDNWRDIISLFKNCEDKLELSVKIFPEFPKLHDLYKKFDLPEKYRVINIQSGRQEQGRIIGIDNIVIVLYFLNQSRRIITK